MADDELDDLLNEYFGSPNLDMLDVEIVWVRGNSGYGSDHIAVNNVTEQEVEEVLLEVPPEVEAKRHRDHPGRTIFWGATRAGRWLFVACDDRREGDRRLLTPITAFEPEEAKHTGEDNDRPEENG